MTTIVVPKASLRAWRRTALLGGACLVLVVIYLVPASHRALALLWEPRPAPEPASLQAQRTTVEEALARVYVKAVGQLRTARGLTLPITNAEADRVAADYTGQLHTLRRRALTAAAQVYGLDADATEAYVQSVDPTLDVPPANATSTVLLVPALYDIVRRTAEASAQVADAGTAALTSPRGGTPTPLPTSTATPTGTPRP